MGRTRQTKVSDLFSLGKRNRETVEKKGKKKGDVESPKRKKKKLNDEDDEAFSPVESSEEEAYSPEKLDIDEEPLVDVVMSSPERSPSPPPKKKGRTPARKKETVLSPKSPIKLTLASPSKRTKKPKKEENRYEWLETIRDANKRKPDDPLYDPRTLYIPESVFNELSPFEAQFWRVKQQHFDTVVFFKKGKFYELYEMDADIGKKEFDLKMTDRVNMRMVGVPESSVHQWAARFLARGYKITQVDQVESSIAMNRRVKSTKAAKKVDKVIKREVSRILTQGTLMDEGFIADFKSHYLMSIKEELNEDSNATSSNFVTFGICIVDCSVGKVYFSTFQDDIQRTELQTVLVQTQPKEFIFEKGEISEKTRQIINNRLDNPGCNFLPPKSDFLTAEDTLTKLSSILNTEELPSQVTKQNKQCLSAFGACLTYLDQLKISQTLVPNFSYENYHSIASGESLIVDGQAIINLEVLENNVDHSDVGSLFRYMDHCSTKFGQRLLRQWICSPLQDIKEINDRLDAIDWLSSKPDILKKIQTSFKSLSDLERSVSRLKSGRSLKVSNLVEILNGLEKISKFIKSLKIPSDEIQNIKSLESCISTSDIYFINFDEKIKLIVNSFDQNKAKENNYIEPKSGMDPKYDEAFTKVQKIHNDLESHLKQQRKNFGIPIKYVHMQKEKYQMEITVDHLKSMDIPNDFQLVSKTRLVKRFYDPFIQQSLKKLADAEEDLNVAKEGVFQHYLDIFNESSTIWTTIVSRMAQLDVLCSLSITSKQSGITMSRPEFVNASNGTYFDVKDIRHPMLSVIMQDNFISNSISLGTEEHPSRVILLTGPNMGGKSTLLRQLCLLVIMAQVGCYVPASFCKLAPVDRIFTRLGASDDIIMGQSTFMMELQETSTVLQYATDRSLIILDELGRGTSTFDGYSIAYATLAHLSQQTKAAVLFSTHYHALTNEFQKDTNISLQHMACHVDEEEKEVVFLYQLQDGVCPRSYGMNVALAAGLPKDIVDRAIVIANKFEVYNQELLNYSLQ